MSLVRAEKLTVRLGGHVALAGVDMGVERGEIVTIVGPNGSGKTTLLRAIIGAVAPAIVNAVLDATGVSITELPVTAEKVYRALHGQ